jgi:hypothetical protein
LKIYIHIGTHKTGSTSLQVFLRKSENALAKQGILIPNSGSPEGKSFNVSCGHHELAWYFLGKHGISSDSSWRDLAEEIEQHDGKKVVISAEAFDNLKTSHMSEIKNYLSGHKIYPVIYLRNPLSYMISAYKQRIKMGTYSGSFRKYLEEHINDVDYNTLIESWISVYGKDNLKIRIFDKVKKFGVESDFCDIIGVNFTELKRYVQRKVNISPGDKEILVMRRINRLKYLYPFKNRYDISVILRKQVMKTHRFSNLVNTLFGLFLSKQLVKKADIAFSHKLLDQKQEDFLNKYVEEEDKHYFEF